MKRLSEKTIKDNTETDASFDFVHTIKGVVISYFLSVVLLFIFSIIAVYSSLSDYMVNIGVNIITALSLIICGFIAAKGVKRAGLLNGAFSGIMYAVILYFIGCAVNLRFEISLSAVTVFVMSIICGAFGGVLGINTSKKRR